MRVTILGSGTGMPVKDRGCAGIYVRVGEEHLVLDAGPGTLKRLLEVGVTYLDLDRILLTHFHPDHSLDLVSMLFAMRMPAPARTKPLTVYGPRGLRRLYRRLDAAWQGWLEPRSYPLRLVEISRTTRRLSGYTVRTMPMTHSTAAVGYRIEAGRTRVVYSGDTDFCEGVIELGRRADLLILECSMPDERKVAGHLTPTECGQIARAAGCRHLVLTHFYPVFEGVDIRRCVRAAFRGRLTLARDLTTFHL